MASSAYHIASLLDKVRYLMVSLCSGDSGQLFTKLLPLFCSRLTFEWTTISLPMVWISNKECFFFGKCIIKSSDNHYVFFHFSTNLLDVERGFNRQFLKYNLNFYVSPKLISYRQEAYVQIFIVEGVEFSCYWFDKILAACPVVWLAFKSICKLEDQQTTTTHLQKDKKKFPNFLRVA